MSRNDHPLDLDGSTAERAPGAGDHGVVQTKPAWRTPVVTRLSLDRTLFAPGSGGDDNFATTA